MFVPYKIRLFSSLFGLPHIPLLSLQWIMLCLDAQSIPAVSTTLVVHRPHHVLLIERLRILVIVLQPVYVRFSNHVIIRRVHVHPIRQSVLWIHAVLQWPSVYHSSLSVFFSPENSTGELLRTKSCMENIHLFLNRRYTTKSTTNSSTTSTIILTTTSLMF